MKLFKKLHSLRSDNFDSHSLETFLESNQLYNLSVQSLLDI